MQAQRAEASQTTDEERMVIFRPNEAFAVVLQKVTCDRPYREVYERQQLEAFFRSK